MHFSKTLFIIFHAYLFVLMCSSVFWKCLHFSILYKTVQIGYYSLLSTYFEDRSASFFKNFVFNQSILIQIRYTNAINRCKSTSYLFINYFLISFKLKLVPFLRRIFLPIHMLRKVFEAVVCYLFQILTTLLTPLIVFDERI